MTPNGGFPMHRTLVALSLSMLAAPSAFACGGFFCDGTPIDQAAERIVFAQDGEETEMHVQITYAGAAEEFAWIVPVAQDPELFTSSTQMFLDLATSTQPTFQLNYEEEGKCKEPVRIGFVGADKSVNFMDSESGVDVIDEERVGPYDTVTLKATDAGELMNWLQDNGYDLADNMESVLAPYVADDSYFVALKLASGQSAGDIEPLGLRYVGNTPTIPIQLTSVAATPDMRLEVYVFGEHRAVPKSYLHVRVNEAAIDWWTAGSNYRQIITDAADEAGGHAFATDYSGGVDIVSTADTTLSGLVGRYGNLTRLSSSVSPAEMTVDPTFVLNPDMGDVSNQHTATHTRHCTGGKYRYKADQSLTLSDGRVIPIPSDKWLDQNEYFSPYSYIDAQLGGINALVIEQTSESGQPSVVADLTDDALADLNLLSVAASCGGCNSAGSPWNAGWLGLGLALFLRRRDER
jgi:hypothetical protein